MNGKHIVANFHNCDFDFAKEINLVDFAATACREAGLTVLNKTSHIFEPQGITFVILLAESHLSVHTWPEYKSVAFDLYVCNHSQDNSLACLSIFDKMCALLQPQKVEKKVIERDDLFSQKK